MAAVIQVVAMSMTLLASTVPSSAATGDQDCQAVAGDSMLLQTKQNRTVLAVASSTGFAINPSGAAATLNEEGYAAVADRCCQGEMIQFIERVVVDQKMEVCNKAGLQGIAPFHSCEKGPQTYADLIANLLADSAKRCRWLAATGTCTATPADCPEYTGLTAPDCACSTSKATEIDFLSSTLSLNNLGGHGPDTGAEEMRYANVGPGIDLVVTAISPYSAPMSGGNAGISTANGFGGLVVRWGTKTDFKFQFVDAGTSTPHTLSEVHMAFFDLDGGMAAGSEVLSGKGYKGYVTDLDTTLLVSREGGQTKFTGTSGVPNPTTPGVATDAQRKATIMFFYENVSEFEINFGFEPLGSFSGAGQQALMLFSGSSVLMDRCTA